MKLRSKFSIEPRFRITYSGRYAFGPDKAALLEQIKNTGSIAKAAKATDRSYMHAWLLIKSMNRDFTNPLVKTIRGGRKRGGATLTKAGSQVLQLYRKIEAQSATATRAAQKKLVHLLRS